MVMRRHHPAGRGALSAKVLAGLTHLDPPTGENTDFLDAWLSERGLTRRIALRAPYLSARAILSRSDLAATLSRRIAQEFVRTDRLQIHELPVKSPVVHTTMLWHRRLDNHPAHRWLRDRIIAVTKTL
jgi:DNA-binding transcriptional LysR family regulator